MDGIPPGGGGGISGPPPVPASRTVILRLPSDLGAFRIRRRDLRAIVLLTVATRTTFTLDASVRRLCRRTRARRTERAGTDLGAKKSACRVLWTGLKVFVSSA